MEIEHIGYAVADIDKSLQKFLELGYTVNSKLFEDNARGIKIIFVKNGAYRVELIAPNKENSPVDSILSKNGCSPYHICYRVDDIDQSVKELKTKGYVVIKPKSLAIAFSENTDKNVVFLYNKNMGLVELVES